VEVLVVEEGGYCTRGRGEVGFGYSTRAMDHFSTPTENLGYCRALSLLERCLPQRKNSQSSTDQRHERATGYSTHRAVSLGFSSPRADCGEIACGDLNEL
jgi:hypothetical protein